MLLRGLVLAVLCFVSSAAVAAPQRTQAIPEVTFAFDSLYGIASWLRQSGREGYIGADVADAMGIARPGGEALVAAWQRGFRSEEVLRIAQVLDDPAADVGEFILFMVQRPDDQVYFYLSTPLGGLQKALVSIPSKNLVMPLERAEAELRFREEILYWKDRSESP
jgi:hypothetical protein